MHLQTFFFFLSVYVYVLYVYLSMRFLERWHKKCMKHLFCFFDALLTDFKQQHRYDNNTSMNPAVIHHFYSSHCCLRAFQHFSSRLTLVMQFNMPSIATEYQTHRFLYFILVRHSKAFEMIKNAGL